VERLSAEPWGFGPPTPKPVKRATEGEPEEETAKRTNPTGEQANGCRPRRGLGRFFARPPRVLLHPGLYSAADFVG
jgi:hypothetical protein